MIDWWSVFHNSLWVVGLAVGLAALSLASYRSRTEGLRLREKLNEFSFQLPFDVGLVLFCLGLLFSGSSWWEKTLWGLLALVFAFQAWGLWRNRPPAPPRPQPEPPPVAAQPGQRRKPGRLGCGLMLLGLLVLGAWLLVTGFQLVGHARSLYTHLQYVERLAGGDVGSLDTADLETAGRHLAGMRRDLEAIQTLVGPLLPAARLLGWLPDYGGDLAAAADLLDLAVAVTAAGDRTFQALSPALDLLSGSPPGAEAELSLGERLLPVLIAAQPELRLARQDLVTAQQAQTRIHASSLSPRVAGLLEKLDRYLPWFETALDGAALAPDLLGANGPRTYLILAQNNYELRPTGGFITGVGELGVENGRLTSLSFSDGYIVDNWQVPHDIPPLDFQRTLFGQLWLFRDANWDADYPTSAQRALEIYARDRGVQTDGVVALNLSALELLVGALDPIYVEGVEEPVTADNVLSIIQQQWEQTFSAEDEGGGKWWLYRKDFMGQIADAAMDKLLTGQDVQPVELALAVKRALDRKDLLIYLTDPQAAALLRRRNWDGALALPSDPSDSLLVVDSNVGYNKMDANVARSIRYQVDLSAADAPRAQVTLTYRNLSARPLEACEQGARFADTYADLMEGCYWDYVRLYAPAGSRLMAGPEPRLLDGSLAARLGEPPLNQPISPTLSVDDWQVWTAFFDLPPNSELTLTYDYLLPSWVVDRRADGPTAYRLRVQKQPGTKAVPLRVEIILPPGAELLESVPDNLPELTTDLRVDREFTIVFREGAP